MDRPTWLQGLQGTETDRQTDRQTDRYGCKGCKGCEVQRQIHTQLWLQGMQDLQRLKGTET